VPGLPTAIFFPWIQKKETTMNWTAPRPMALNVTLLAVAAGLCTPALDATAAELQLKHIPAEAKWYAHLDADAVRSSKVVTTFYEDCVREKMTAPAVWAQAFNMVEWQWGFHPINDLHSVTVYGTRLSAKQGVLVLRAKTNNNLLTTIAEKAPQHREQDYRDYTLHTWKQEHDGEELEMAAAFHRTNVVVFASSVEMLKTALDRLDGQGQSMADSDSPLGEHVPGGAMIVARAVDLNNVAGDEFPVLAQLERLNYVEGEDGDEWFSRVKLVTRDAEVAERFADVIRGFQSVIWLAADDAPRMREMVRDTDVDVNDKTIEVSFREPTVDIIEQIPKVCEMIERHGKR
jgi:hypothetical protein